MPQTFFHNYPYSQKYDLIRLTPYHWQPCISQFRDITKCLQVPVAKFSDLVRLVIATSW